MYSKTLSKDMTVSVYVENPEVRDYCTLLLYVEWRDSITNRVIAGKSMYALNQPGTLLPDRFPRNAEELIKVAYAILDGDLSAEIDAYMTPSGANDMRTMIKTDALFMLSEEEMQDLEEELYNA
jgi:hypothetical protein